MGRVITGATIILLLLARGAVGADTRFAIIGDYGTDNAPARAVANLVITNFAPEFIVTLGDNNYGTAADFDDAVGKYFARYIGSYSGAHGPGSATNRFFPAIGNHDYYSDGYAAYTGYFTLPGNERYYDVRRGPVHVFILNSDDHEPDGTSSTSTQAMWLSNRLAVSEAPWKLVVSHHAPYSSSGSDATARWPYAQWGADIVLAGHSHNYERIEQNGFPYIVNGVGGAAFAPISTPMAGSRVHIDDKYGAMLASANDAQITFEFYSVDAVLRDRFTLHRPRLHIARKASQVDVGWSTNGTLFRLEAFRATNWVELTQPATVRGTNNVVTVPLNAGREVFRLRRR